MDIISVIANLIAVASLAAKVSKRLGKVSSLRHIPQQIFLLSNEVSLPSTLRHLPRLNNAISGI